MPIWNSHDYQGIRPTTYNLINTGQSLAANVTYLPAALNLYLARETWRMTTYAFGGALYSQLKRGTTPYTRSIRDGGGAIMCVHGEADGAGDISTSDYLADLKEWISTYRNDLQNPSIPFLVDQCSSQVVYAGDGMGKRMAGPTLAQWQITKQSPAIPNVFCVGPKYQYPYEDSGTHPTGGQYVHLLPAGCAWMGHKWGQILARVLSGVQWRPFEPVSASRSSTTVTLTCYVPYPPIVIDTTTVASQTSRGFRFYNVTSGSFITINSVSASGSNITLTLNSTPTDTNNKLMYAWVTDYNDPPRFGAGDDHSVGGYYCMGNLRDSDTAGSFVGGATGAPYQMGNWLVQFIMDCN